MSEAPWPSRRATTWLILILTFANIFSYVDRIVLNLMVGPIREAFNLTDTGVSLLQGVAFGLFYTLAALPIGRLVDTWERRRIIAAGTTVFSLGTVACGMSQSFGQLFAARVAVGAGEASLAPSAYSMLADSHPKDRLAGAMSIYTMGAFLGIGTAYALGGVLVQWAMNAGPQNLPLLGEVAPWQLAFMMCGAPGLIAALLVLTLKEPVRRETAAQKAAGAPPVRAVAGHLKGSSSFFVALIAGFCLVTLSSYASTSWNPAFLGRVHGMAPREVGLSLGALVLVFGVSGVLTAGWLSNRLQSRGVRSAPIWVALAGVALGWLPGIFAPLVDSAPAALALLGVREFFMVFPFPLAAAAIQMATPGRMRGQVSAVYMFAINLVGLGLGPTITALLSDYVFTEPTGVRYSLAWVNGAIAPLAMLLLVLAARAFPKAVARAEAQA